MQRETPGADHRETPCPRSSSAHRPRSWPAAPLAIPRRPVPPATRVAPSSMPCWIRSCTLLHCRSDTSGPTSTPSSPSWQEPRPTAGEVATAPPGSGHRSDAAVSPERRNGRRRLWDSSFNPGFGTTVKVHELLDAIQRVSEDRRAVEVIWRPRPGGLHSARGRRPLPSTGSANAGAAVAMSTAATKATSTVMRPSDLMRAPAGRRGRCARPRGRRRRRCHRSMCASTESKRRR